MRKALLGALVGAGLVVLALGVFDNCREVFAQHPAPQPPVRPGGDLLVVPGPIGEKGQLLTVIDPNLRVIGVYNVDRLDGKIALRSVRDIRWDLQMMYLNNESPLPQEIRSLLEPR
jgi:hypothetical protein